MTTIDRRQFSVLLAASGMSPGQAIPADSWPTRPVRVPVPCPAGGSSDPPMRWVTVRLQELLGHPVVVGKVGGWRNDRYRPARGICA
jgi:tripartite-type tricarboxylate transporter receptor subunit TctC